MTEQITKIKVCNDQTAIIDFKNTTDLGVNDITFTGEEKITEEFNATFQKAVESVIAIMPSLKNDQSKITMNSITFAYSDANKIEKVSYAVKYQPQNSILANIPVNNVPIYKDTFTEKTFSVSGKDEKLLYEILEHASKYIAGNTRTKQMKLEVVS